MNDKAIREVLGLALESINQQLGYQVLEVKASWLDTSTHAKSSFILESLRIDMATKAEGQ